ncbi:MAG TPA: EAL domain-containing protein [Solirubrobacteraceae bacterium]|nr:EAL domain-containing protein [Solirubrobacteraceae bacterium]
MAASPQAPRRTSLGRRLVLSLLTMLLPLAVLAAVALYTQWGSAAEQDRLERETIREFEVVARARDAAERVRTEARAAAAAPNAHAIGRAHEARAALGRALDDLQRRVDDGRERAATRAAATAARRGDVEGVENALTGVRNRSMHELTRRSAEIRTRDRRQLGALLVLLLASGLVAVLLASKLRRDIARPLTELRDAARRIGDEDFSRRVRVGGDDELHDVAEAFNGMMDRLVEGRDQLVHQAFHDALTGLPNRALFRDRTQQALARAYNGRRPQAGGVAVLFCDLDDFKSINDSLGHGAGDALLRAVATRLRTTLRVEDTIARLGGDEFAILLEEVADPKAAEATARRLLGALTLPIVLRTAGDAEVVARASIGVALSTGPDDTAEDLLRDADAAMYAAKNGGRNRHRVFEADMHERALERFALEGELRRALDRGEFMLDYQPVLELATHRVVAVEALVRWRHPERGIVAPNDFIPTAEETGLIVPLGRWVLRQACRCARTLQEQAAGREGLVMSVNLSPRQFHDPHLVADVREAVEEAGIDARTLVLEITESMLTADLDATAETLARLKALGVRLAIDDFGTGYSTLSYLRRFPIDILKLDRELIGAGSGPDAKLTKAIVGLGHSLELATVAEGIERPEQEEELRALGCQLGQGFLFARPMGEAELTRRLSEGDQRLTMRSVTPDVIDAPLSAVPRRTSR